MVQSKNNLLRPLSQRSIASSFIFRPINQNKDLRDAEPDNYLNKKGMGSRVSLSDFLDQKLKKDSQLPRTVKGKLRPFASPLGVRDKEVFADHQAVEDKEENSSLNQVIFEQFRHSDAGKDGKRSYGSCESANLSLSFGLSPEHDGVCASKLREGASKQQKPFNGHGERSSAPKHLLISDNCERKEKEREKSFILCCKRPRHRYNHYANGCGWWDCDREGVDAEEVGIGEIWEGVGSTTFGDWH